MSNSSCCATTQPSHACLSEAPCAAEQALSSSPQKRRIERIPVNSVAVDVEAISLELVLRDIADSSRIADELARRMTEDCSTWRDALVDTADGVSELARLAKNLVPDAGERVGDIAFKLTSCAHSAGQTNGGAA